MAASRPSARRGRPTTLCIDLQRLAEVVHASGYDARRICQHLGISTRSLQRWFCAHMDCTPCEWIIEQRLQRARRLLETSSSVKEVAYSLGFKQPSQFSRDFKRRFGHQPSAELGRARPQRQREKGQPAPADGRGAA